MTEEEPNKVSGSEASRMESGHIVDRNAKRKRKKDVTLQDLWKKLQHLQKENREMKKTISQIEKAVKPEGGTQPSKKVQLFEKTEEGKPKFTDLEVDIIKRTKSQGRLKTTDVEQIFSDNGIERSRQACRDWLQRIATRLNESELVNAIELEYRSGSQGGRDGGK